MLYFVIPLRSAGTAKDWPAVQNLLQSTLLSVHNQTSPDFRILLVCHDKPSEVDVPESCSVLEAPFPEPALRTIELADTDRLRVLHADKGRKLLYGLSVARQDPSAYVAFLDADDLVSNRLAQFVSDFRNENGWYFDSGYRLNLSSPRFLYRRNKFHEECGSSHILKAALAPFPEHPDFSRDLGDYFIRRYEVHAHIRDCMDKLGHPLQPLPFPGAIYTFNSQNLYATTFREKDSRLRKAARFLLKGKYVTQALRQEFTIR